MTLLVDTFEPDNIFRLIKQSIECERKSLVSSGFADYLFMDVNGRRIQIERKQCGELLANIDHVETQLRREMVAADETILLVEGITEATQWGVDCYAKSEDRPYYRLARSYGTMKHPQHGLFARLQSWFWQLDHLGISVYRTSNYNDTARALVSWYRASQKSEHTTLQRYIKPQIRLEHHDPAVMTLMGIAGVNLGETRAKALIACFGSVWDTINAPASELIKVEGIGPVIAKQLIEALARPWDD